MPASDDPLAMYIDGVALFAAPFSSFRLEDVTAGKHLLKDDNLLVE
jgi:hypothetical protein